MSAHADAFSFMHEDRTFTCSVEASRASAGDRWWWFTVSTEAHQRHAPFPADASDTKEDVRRRVVAYYENRLTRRAEPPQARWHSRGAAKPAPATPPSAGEASPS